MENESFIVRDVHEIKNALTKLTVRIELVYDTLRGNEILKDGGLIADILNQKAEIAALTKRVDAIDAKETKRFLYINWLWAAAGIILSTIIISIINHIFK